MLLCCLMGILGILGNNIRNYSIPYLICNAALITIIEYFLHLVFIYSLYDFKLGRQEIQHFCIVALFLKRNDCFNNNSGFLVILLCIYSGPQLLVTARGIFCVDGTDKKLETVYCIYCTLIWYIHLMLFEFLANNLVSILVYRPIPPISYFHFKDARVRLKLLSLSAMCFILNPAFSLVLYPR